MTRDEILSTYKIENGRIASPGKFEGEPIWAPYFYECACEGEGEDVVAEDGWPTTTIFDHLEQDWEEFPELEGIAQIHLTEDSQGFIYCIAVKEEELT